MRFFPNFLLRDVLLWYLALATLAALAAFAPWELGRKADPFASAPEGIRPEWYFTFMSQTLKYLPPTVLGFEGEHVGILAFGVVALVLFLVPLLDRRAARGEPNPLFSAAGAALLAFLAVMTVLAPWSRPATRCMPSIPSRSRRSSRALCTRASRV